MQKSIQELFNSLNIKSIIHYFSNNSGLLESIEVYAAVFKYQFYKAINSSGPEHYLNNWYTVKNSYVILQILLERAD
jgi:hypothetical protein